MYHHEQIKVNVAEAIAADEAVTAFCVEHFGRGLQVFVNRYGEEGYPSETESPFLFIYSDGENELGAVDEETFEFVMDIGGLDGDASSPRRKVLSVRTDTASGVSVSGIADLVEDLRELVYAALVRCRPGAMFRTAVRSESNFTDYPLEWASLRVSYFEPVTLDQE